MYFYNKNISYYIYMEYIFLRVVQPVAQILLYAGWPNIPKNKN